MKNFPGIFLSITGVIVLTALFFSFRFNNMSFSGKPAVDENRIVAPFNEVHAAGGFEIKIKQGTQTPIHLAGNAEDIKMISTEVKGNALYINVDNKGNKNYNMGKVIIEITVPDLYAVKTAGSCTVMSNGTFGGGKDMEFAVSGSGSISMDINADELEGNISGSGDIQLSGKAKETELSISGSGSFNCENLSTASAEISVAGSGNTYITVTSELEANISGSGSVYYKGSPKVQSNIAGSGSVKAK